MYSHKCLVSFYLECSISSLKIKKPRCWQQSPLSVGPTGGAWVRHPGSCPGRGVSLHLTAVMLSRVRTYVQQTHQHRNAHSMPFILSQGIQSEKSKKSTSLKRSLQPRGGWCFLPIVWIHPSSANRSLVDKSGPCFSPKEDDLRRHSNEKHGLGVGGGLGLSPAPAISYSVTLSGPRTLISEVGFTGRQGDPPSNAQHSSRLLCLESDRRERVSAPFSPDTMGVFGTCPPPWAVRAALRGGASDPAAPTALPRKLYELLGPPFPQL